MTARLLKMADDKQPPPLFGDDDDLPATGDNNNPFDNPKVLSISNLILPTIVTIKCNFMVDIACFVPIQLY